VVLTEEASRQLVYLGTLRTQLDVILPYFLEYANEEQRRRWFPGMAAGELLTAIAMTEPETGSDLAGMRTTAVRDGDTYVLNGAKTFITGGILADLVIVVARTSTDPANRRAGLTLLVVEDGMPGFTRGRKLDKLGLRVQDTAELHFSDVRVPVANRLGEEGEAFGYLGHNLPQERLAIAVGAVAQSRAALNETIGYVKERKAFGTPIASFQNSKFELAAVATEIEAARPCSTGPSSSRSGAFCPVPTPPARSSSARRSKAGPWTAASSFSGAYGYMLEYPIARLYADARVTRIYGGTSEVLKTIIGRSLGL
jgi:acyl-CoA dehydrogenase